MPAKPSSKFTKNVVKRVTKRTAKSSDHAAKPRPYRLPSLTEDVLSPPQRELIESIRSGPRGGRIRLDGPFGVYLHAPPFGELVQKLGGFCRYQTGVPPRLSEFAILVIARQWRAQYEWHVHSAIAQSAGVKPATIAALRAGRAPTTAAKDERAVYDFITELHKTRRVGNPTYKRLNAVLGDAATVEFVGIVGYYTLVAMMLDVFRVPIPDGAVNPFAEPA